MAEDKKTDQAGAPEAAGSKKINEMTLREIEAKLAEVKEKQWGWTSRYARHLLLRKKTLGA